MTKKILLATFILGIIFFRLSTEKQISDKEYALQVLDQYIRYYCPRDNVCSRHQALARMQRDWPHIYKLGFSILEENE
jgi:hypothetical protein